MLVHKGYKVCGQTPMNTVGLTIFFERPTKYLVDCDVAQTHRFSADVLPWFFNQKSKQSANEKKGIGFWADISLIEDGKAVSI